MPTPSESLKLTYEDYLLFPDDGKRHEVIDGEHFLSPAPSTRHQTLLLNLAWQLKTFLRRHPLGEVWIAPVDVILSEADVVQPDLVLVAAAHAHIVTEKHVRGVPDLVVEILSANTRRQDEVVKRKLYHRSGVGEYWIVDPEVERVRVYRGGEGGEWACSDLDAEAGGTLTTPLLPGLAVPLAELFGE